MQNFGKYDFRQDMDAIYQVSFGLEGVKYSIQVKYWTLMGSSMIDLQDFLNEVEIFVTQEKATNKPMVARPLVWILANCWK